MTEYNRRLHESKDEQKYIDELDSLDWGEMPKLTKQLQEEGEYIDDVTTLDNAEVVKLKKQHHTPG